MHSRQYYPRDAPRLRRPRREGATRGIPRGRLDADQHNGGLGPGENNGLRAIRGEAKGIGAQSVPTVATKEQVLYYGTASPGKVRALLADHKETVG